MLHLLDHIKKSIICHRRGHLWVWKPLHKERCARCGKIRDKKKGE